MRSIKIGNRVVSEASRTFLVAEIGLNHNGNISLAKRMIREARRAGADAVKFQVYRTDSFIHPVRAREQFCLLKKYELPFEAVKDLKRFADREGVIFFASAFDFESVDLLYRLKAPVMKVASGEMSNLAFVRYIAGKEWPLFISTGLHDLSEIERTVREVEKVNKALVLFYCLSEYPLVYEHAGLNGITLFRERFRHLTGFSDHSDGDLLDIMAVCLGARVIEKHFTLDRKGPGPDHSISLDVRQFKDLARHIRITELILGQKEKRLTGREKAIRKNARKGIYAARAIRKGEKITWSKIKLLRPEAAAPASEISRFLNKKARRSFSVNEPLSFS
ncbi:MAG: N-acetylneuraminate synthase family protein [bacterium]|nr:N-acetylneuraminate synthase family protein [bacterium]